MKQKAFTLKAMIFGLICLLIVCFFPAFSSKFMLLKESMSGYLPVLPLFLIILISFVWNIIASLISKKLALSSKELAVVFGFMLFISWIPSTESSLVRHLILPRYTELTSNKTWEEAGVTSRLPDELFPEKLPEEGKSVDKKEAGNKKDKIGEKVHMRFIQGADEGTALTETVPFTAWITPMLRWIPILIVISICVLGMTYIVHKQWSYHEQLRYPLASVADSLIKQDDSGWGGTIYRNRLFIAGFTFVFFLKLLMYLNTWFPTQIPKIPGEYSLGWSHLFPILRDSNALLFCIQWMSISFAMIGIAFLVPSDVSLSVGLTAPLGSLLAVNYFVATGNPVSSGDLDILRSGGFIAFGLILLYTGRTYYFPLFLKAFVPTHKTVNEIDRSQVWAARIFLIAYIGLIFIFRSIGFDFLISFVYVTFFLLIFLVVTRLVCETGIPEMAPYWSLPSLMTGLFGPAAIGALPIIFMTLLSTTMTNSGQFAMPYMATGLRVLDDNKVNLKRFAVVSQFVILIALVVCLVTTLTISYTKGEGKLGYPEKRTIHNGVTQVLKMKDTGDLEASQAASGFGKLSLISADGKTFGILLTGIAAILVLYILRFRFSKWPIHPIFLILLGTSVAQKTWFCFLFGWVIKNLVVKFGGGSAYNKVKPLFIGLIIGEFTCMALTLLVGLIYFMFTGNPAGNFR